MDVKPFLHRDHIIIEGLEVPIRIGTTAQEQAFPQVIKLNIDIYLSLQQAGLTDNLSRTIDYAAVINDIHKNLKECPFNLVEAVGEKVASLILRKPRVQAVSVKIRKKVFTGIEAVGVSIYREKKVR